MESDEEDLDRHERQGMSTSAGPHESGGTASNAGQLHARPKHNQPGEVASMSKILIGRYQATIYPDGEASRGDQSRFEGKGNRQRIEKGPDEGSRIKEKLNKAFFL